MLNKIKKHKIIVFIFLVLFIAMTAYISCIFNNTLRAYNIIKQNYSTFNYPNTIEVHSGTIKSSGDIELFICRVSVENAYGQRKYDYFIADNESMFSLDSFEDSGITMPQSTYDEAESKNISVLLINFLIDKDW